MAEESAKLRIPYIAAAQAQKHVTHNEGMTLLDTLVQLSVIDKDLLAPPGSPAEGDTYIVAGAGGTATGAWTGWDKRVARYIDGEWRSYLPGQGGGAGWLAWVLDEDAMYRFDGTAWALAGIEGPIGPSGAPGANGADGADGQSFQPDAVVSLIAGRTTYDSEVVAFSVLVVSDSTNGNEPTLYFKLSATPADWSAPLPWTAGSGAVSGVVVRAATTANVTIATALNSGDTVDGVTLAAGDLVLVKDQVSAAENGVYRASATPARAAAYSTYDAHAGIVVSVKEGTLNGDTIFTCTSDEGGTLNTDPIDFLDLWTAQTPAGELTYNYDKTARPGWINLDGSTITDGALDNPRCAARYSWMVSGNNLLLTDPRGRGLRIWANGSANDPDRLTRTAGVAGGPTGDEPGTDQGFAVEDHEHTYQRSDNQTSVQSGASNRHDVYSTQNTGGVVGATVSTETRGINHAFCIQMRLG